MIRSRVPALAACTVVSAASLVALAAGTASALPSCTVSAAYSVNLLANGGAEDNAGAYTGTGSATRIPATTPNCWTTGGSATSGTGITVNSTSGHNASTNNVLAPAPYTFATVQKSAYANAPITTPTGVDVGSNFFYGGDLPLDADSYSTMTQTIPVAALAPTTGNQATYTLAGLLGGYYNQGDNAVVTATFLDGSGSSLGSASIGPVSATDRGNVTQLLARQATGSLPLGTASVQVVAKLAMVGNGNNNGYADNLSFVLGAPAGTTGGGAPGTDLPEVGVPVALVVLGLAGAGATVAVRRRRA